MSNYHEKWDLTTIPELEWNSENGRRQRAKGPAVTREKRKPCSLCGYRLNGTESRSKCPNCGYQHTRDEWRNKR